MPSPSINIIGSGSMGHLWTAYLLDKQVNVRLYARQPQDSQQYILQSPQRRFACNITHHSLNLEKSVKAREITPPSNAPNDPKDGLITSKVTMPFFIRSYTPQDSTLSTTSTGYSRLNNWQKPDFLLICVKATALQGLCVELKSISPPETPIILMMNGMGIIEMAQQYLPETTIYQASTSHGARLENFDLWHTGHGETLIGNIDEKNSLKKNDKPIADLISTLNNALPLVRWSDNHQEVLWTKLLINSIINPLTTIHNVQNGGLLSSKKINRQAKTLTQQLEPIIRKYLPSQNWQSIFEKVELVANQTYTNVSSMRQDVLMGKKTEIDFITGYLLKMAAKQQINLPEHEQMVNQIKLLEKES